MFFEFIRFAVLAITFFFSSSSLECCSSFNAKEIERIEIEENRGVLKFFTPSLLISEQNEKDKEVLGKMRNLFFAKSERYHIK